MKDIINSCLEQLRKTFNIYVYSIAFIAMSSVIRFLDDTFGFKKSELKIFEFKVQPDYFSLVYGILFGLFLFILFLQVRQLKNTLSDALTKETDQKIAINRAVIYFPWLTSPFRAGTFSSKAFYLLLLIGMLELISLIYAHAFNRMPKIANKWGFQLIGYIDAFIFLFGCLLLFFIRKDILKIHSNLRY